MTTTHNYINKNNSIIKPKNFMVEYYHKDNPWKIFHLKISWTSDIDIKEKVNEKWYEVKNIEIIKKTDFVKNFKKWFNRVFSFWYKYNEKNELLFLKAFSSALRDWLNERDALDQSKISFWKSNKKCRKMVDDMIKTYKEWNFENMYQVFEMNEELFSTNFLTTLKTISRGQAETKIYKIISNPKKYHKLQNESEGFVELQESMLILYQELSDKIKPTLYYLLFEIMVVLWITWFLLPNLMGEMGKMRDMSKDTYMYVWEFVLWLSHLITWYWLYILWGFLTLFLIWRFIYKNSYEFKKKLHELSLKTWLIWDLLTVFYTKKVVSLLSVFFQSWMGRSKAYKICSNLTPLIPQQEELKNISRKITSISPTEIFWLYKEEEREEYFTESFYLNLIKFSSEKNEQSGQYNKAFAGILKNVDEIYENDLKKYPDKIKNFIKYAGMGLVAICVVWIFIIFMVTIQNGMGKLW